MATNKRDFKTYFRYDGNHRIIPGSNILSRNKPKSGGRWTEDEAYECCGPCVPGWEDSVGPTNIVVTVDAVGDNPVTWYLLAFFDFYNVGYIERSAAATVVSFIVGDSTTSITISCGAFPLWANYVDYFVRPTGGSYDTLGDYFQENNMPFTIDLSSVGDLTYAEMLAVPIHQDWNSCETTTTTTTIACNDILRDGGFEEWTTNGRTTPVYWFGGERESSIVHDGLYSMHLDDDYSSTFQFFTSTTTCYTLDFWYYSTVEGCAQFLVVRFGKMIVEYLQDDGSWSTDPNNIELPSSDGEWVNYTNTFTTDSGMTHVLEFIAGERCSVYFDDARLCNNCGPRYTTTTTTTVASTTTTTTTTATPTTTTTTTVDVPSDERLKSNIVPTGNKVGDMDEYTWEWNEIAKVLGLDKYPNQGVIAQEVMHKYPDAVRLDTDGYYRVNLSKLVKK